MNGVLLHGSKVILRADLPIFDAKKIAHPIYISGGEEHEVWMAGGTACKSLGLGLAGFVSSVDETGEVADVGIREIANLAYVEGYSALAFECFEVIVFELFDQSCAVSQHGIDHLRFKWQCQQEEGP